MRAWVLLLLSLAFCQSVVGQNARMDSLRLVIQKELKTEELVRKAHDRLADQMQKGDTSGTSLLIEFIKQEAQRAHIEGFRPNEEIALALFQSRFDSVFSLLNRSEWPVAESRSRPFDLFSFTRSELRPYTSWVEQEIRKYVTDSLEKEFLRTVASRAPYYSMLRFDYSDPVVIRWLSAPITPRMRQVIENRKYVSPSTADLRHPLGMAVWIGSSYPFNTGRLGRFVRDDLGFGIALATQYKRISLLLNYVTGSGRVRDSLPNKVRTLEKGTPLMTSQLDAALGYYLVNTSKFRLVPAVGVSALNIRAPGYLTKQDTSLKRGGISSSGPMAGIELAFKIRSSVFTEYGSQPMEMTWSAVSIRYTVAMPNFQRQYGDGAGLRHTVTLSLSTGCMFPFGLRRSFRQGFFGGKVPRDIVPYDGHTRFPNTRSHSARTRSRA